MISIKFFLYFIIYFLFLFIIYLLYEFKEIKEFKGNKENDLNKLFNSEYPIYTYIIYYDTGYAINKNQINIKEDNPFIIKKKYYNYFNEENNNYIYKSSYKQTYIFNFNTSIYMIIYIFSLISFMIL